MNRRRITMRTRRIILFALAVLGAQVAAFAQNDDMYFVPKTKAQKVAEQKAYERQLAKARANYVYGMRDVDEYNRRHRLQSTIVPIDSSGVADDIIDFQPGTGVYPDSAYMDSVTNIMPMNDFAEEDYKYSRRMNRWEDFYPWYDRMYYDPWIEPWYADYWYHPWYHDYWYSSRWYYGPYYGYWWSNPWYSAYWGWSAPWHYGWYGPYYSYWHHPRYIGIGGTGVGHSGRGTSATFRTGRHPLAGYDRGNSNANRGKANPNLTTSRTRNRSYNAGERFGTNNSNSRSSQPFGGSVINRNAGGSFGGGSRGGGFGGGGSHGGGSHGGGFGGRR